MLLLKLLKNGQKKIGLTANLPVNQPEEMDDTYNPLTIRFKDVNEEDHDKDLAQLQIRVQSHKCNDYCLRKSLTTDKEQRAK